MEHDKLISAMKALAWEEAKSKLRGVAALSGQTYGGDPETIKRWEEIGARIEAFIEAFEDDGLHE